MIDLSTFAEIIGREIVITRYPGQQGRWCCSIKGAEVMQNGGLLSEHGNGPSPTAAMGDYALRIAGKRLALGAYTGARQEFCVPADLVGVAS